MIVIMLCFMCFGYLIHYIVIFNLVRYKTKLQTLIEFKALPSPHIPQPSQSQKPAVEWEDMVHFFFPSAGSLQ